MFQDSAAARMCSGTFRINRTAHRNRLSVNAFALQVSTLIVKSSFCTTTKLQTLPRSMALRIPKTILECREEYWSRLLRPPRWTAKKLASIRTPSSLVIHQRDTTHLHVDKKFGPLHAAAPSQNPLRKTKTWGHRHNTGNGAAFTSFYVR
uniref:Uncharacterized protein n=1 Tax=Toxoplasma gondii (strain ATCC 50861 / VEG) TaxID=432359 RepID=A0A0F7VAE8_TOXGV|nr:TPA: hypothetical protein BN1205_031470 [Toxoplasma gondii VEG]